MVSVIFNAKPSIITYQLCNLWNLCELADIQGLFLCTIGCESELTFYVQVGMCGMYVAYVKTYLCVLYAYAPLFLHSCVCVCIFQCIGVSVYPSNDLSILCAVVPGFWSLYPAVSSSSISLDSLL